MECSDIYTLNEVIEALEEIEKHGHGDLNVAKALMTLALEIKKLNDGSGGSL